MPRDELTQALLSRRTGNPTIDQAYENLYRQRPELAGLVEQLVLKDLGKGVNARIPLPLDGRFVELNSRISRPAADWEGTLVHEMTHLSDLRDPYDREVALRGSQKTPYGRDPFELRGVDASKEYNRRKAAGQQW